MFKRQGVVLSDSTLGGWVNAVAQLVKPLYEAQKKKVLSTSYLQADETPIQVLECEKAGSSHRGYHWVYQDPVLRLVLFDYRSGRGREGPDQILKNFKGHLLRRGPLDKPMDTECMNSSDSEPVLPSYTVGHMSGASSARQKTATGIERSMYCNKYKNCMR